MPSINTIPVEILNAIHSELSPRQKVSLGLTSKHLWHLTAPNLYHSVTLTTLEATAAESFIQAAAKHGHLVRSLRIVIPPNCTGPAAQTKDKRQWSLAAGKPALRILQGAHDNLLPNLNHIAIEFPTHYGSHHAGSVDNWLGHPSSPNLRRAVSVFTSLAKRRDRTTITHLSIINLPMSAAQRIMGYPMKGHNAFLGSLERFDLSLWVAGEATSSLPVRQNGYNERYLGMVRIENVQEDSFTLPALFFDHLTSVKRIRFEASLHSAIGQIDPNERTWKLPFVSKTSPVDTMPLLEKLELVNIMVDTSLLEFLDTRAGKKPLALRLENTWAYERRRGWTDDPKNPNWVGGDDGEFNGSKWVRVLEGVKGRIERMNGPKLKSFELVPRGDDESCACLRRRPPFRYAVFEVHGHRNVEIHLVDVRELGEGGERKKDFEAEARLLEAIRVFNRR